MTGDQVRDIWFWSPLVHVGGYDAGEVDDLLRRVAVELDAGRPAEPLVESATFLEGKWERRYDIDAVDWFLGQFLLPSGHAGISDDPWHDLPVAQLTRAKSRADFSEECANAWREFGQIPGTHLRWGPAGKFRTELCTAEQQPLASSRGLWHETVSAGGRDFTYTSWHSLPSHCGAPPKTWSSPLFPSWRELADSETGVPVLYTNGRNYFWSAQASIMFPDQRWLRFLVRGTGLMNAVMTAVDQAGNKVARYRLARKQAGFLSLSKSVEITVHPCQELTDELALALAESAYELQSYFQGSMSD